MFPVPNIPVSRWSFLNRTLMFLAGTHDARGYNQWGHLNRFVKKHTEDEEEAKPILEDFLTVPVFKVEDTDGKPLDYQNIEPPSPPLMEVAREWVSSIHFFPANNPPKSGTRFVIQTECFCKVRVLARYVQFLDADAYHKIYISS
jgi:hypothetical protein